MFQSVFENDYSNTRKHTPTIHFIFDYSFRKQGWLSIKLQKYFKKYLIKLELTLNVLLIDQFDRNRTIFLIPVTFPIKTFKDTRYARHIPLIFVH